MRIWPQNWDSDLKVVNLTSKLGIWPRNWESDFKAENVTSKLKIWPPNWKFNSKLRFWPQYMIKNLNLDKKTEFLTLLARKSYWWNNESFLRTQIYCARSLVQKIRFFYRKCFRFGERVKSIENVAWPWRGREKPKNGGAG